MKRARERDVIEQFLSFLRENGYPNLELDNCPDEYNRDSRDIDAIAGGFAIEHTTVDGVPGQRGHDDRFLRLAQEIKVELRQGLDFQVNVTLSYDDLLGVTAQSIPTIRAALLAWLRALLPSLEDGMHRFARTPDLPFAILIRKWHDRMPGVFFMRDFPGDPTRGKQLLGQLARKAEKLRLYKDTPEGYTTLLLIELNSSALMGTYDFIEWFYTAYSSSGLDGVDEAWLVSAFDSSSVEFWKLGEEPIGPLFSGLDTKEVCNPADQASS